MYYIKCFQWTQFVLWAHTIEVDKYRLGHLKKNRKRNEPISFLFISFLFLKIFGFFDLDTLVFRLNQHFQPFGKVISHLNWPIIHFIYFYVSPFFFFFFLFAPFPFLSFFCLLFFQLFVESHCLGYTRNTDSGVKLEMLLLVFIFMWKLDEVTWEHHNDVYCDTSHAIKVYCVYF